MQGPARRPLEGPPPGPWMRWSFRLTVIVATLLLFELTARFAVRAELLRYVPLKATNQPGRFLGDINPVFGVWHFPNLNLEGVATNAFGMRDKPRTLEGPGGPRVVVLGDSFVEGLGVLDGQRMLDWLERESGVEHLNFGVSGSFGPLQEVLCYETLASRFEHDRVYMFCLPDNDFTDLEFVDPKRFRPYLQRGTDGDYEVYYPITFEERRRAKTPSLSKRINHWLQSELYAANALKQVRWRNLVPKDPTAPAAYDDFSAELGQQLLYCYGRLATDVGPRPLTVFIIPRNGDLVAALAGHLEGRTPKLLAGLSESHPNVTVVDLLPGFLAEIERRRIDPADLFLPNDGHWSPLGHRVASELVRDSAAGQQLAH